jgi:hypothetical protein
VTEVQDSGGDRPANESNDEIRVTEEMVSAAAEILWRDPFAGISESLAEEMARKMLIIALSVHRKRNVATDLEEPQQQ